MQGLALVEDVWDALPNMIKGIVLYKSVIYANSQTCLGRSVHMLLLITFAPIHRLTSVWDGL